MIYDVSKLTSSARKCINCFWLAVATKNCFETTKVEDTYYH
jgi:hypothetical protein